MRRTSRAAAGLDGRSDRVGHDGADGEVDPPVAEQGSDPFTTALVSADLIWMRDTIKIMRSRG
jgi:hypothetical protein